MDIWIKVVVCMAILVAVLVSFTAAQDDPLGRIPTTGDVLDEMLMPTSESPEEISPDVLERHMRMTANSAQTGERVCYYNGEKYSEGALITTESGNQLKCDCDSENNCQWI